MDSIVDSVSPPVRILVVQLHPARELAAHKGGQRAGIAAAEDDTLAALSALPDVDLLSASSAYACLELTGRSRADLVIIDRLSADATAVVLSGLRSEGPPAVVVVEGGPGADERALEAFRRGASDCVVRGADLADVLPRVAREQICRWRARQEDDGEPGAVANLKFYGENIIQNMNSALVVVERRGAITSANPTAEAILRCAAGELLGQPIGRWFDTGSEESHLIARTLDEGARFKGAEALVRRTDGSVAPIGLSCSPLLDADGKTLGAVVIFQDLSEIRQLQRQVLQSEKMASIGQLAAGIAHEINNPMGFIHANLAQMSEYLADLRRVWDGVGVLQKAVQDGRLDAVRLASDELNLLSEELDVDFVLSDFAKALLESKEGSERIRNIVRDLRDFSHPDKGELVLADVNECIDSTASIVWTMMKHSVVLEKHLSDLPNVRCYPMQLKQVFMNLLVNAYQAIQEQIGETGGRGEIHITTRPLRGGVAVSVRDTGVGIPPENLDRIFDPFFTSKEVGSGIGLGLSNSYTIIERHGGSIRVDSQPGEGSTFEVWLPLGDDPKAENGH